MKGIYSQRRYMGEVRELRKCDELGGGF